MVLGFPGLVLPGDWGSGPRRSRGLSPLENMAANTNEHIHSQAGIMKAFSIFCFDMIYQSD